MTKSSIGERRLHPRLPHRTEVVFDDEFGDGLFYVYSKDVSMGGLYLESDIPVSKGSMLFLSFALPGHKRRIHVTGEVVRSIHSGISLGVGVRFVGLSDLAKRRLEDFLAL